MFYIFYHNLKKLIMEYIENHCIVHFKWVNCMVRELYLNKGFLKT